MAENILVTGKKISSMELVTNVTGNEKIPTGQSDDLALTPNQIADHTIARGDLANQEDLSQVEVSLGTQITDLESNVNASNNSIRGLIAAEEAARIAADNLKVDKEGSVSSVAGRVGNVVLAPSDVLVEGFGSQEDVNKYIAKPFLSGYTYGLGERVVLNSGEIVKSAVDGNVNDPNGGMVGWVSVISDGLSDTVQTFNTPEAGVNAVTGVADGAYFNVRSSNDESYVDEYQNVGGVPTPTGKTNPSSTLVQDVRIKAPYFFNTVSAMVTANNISDGMIVGTKGYHDVFDDGGAIYLISAVATDYSIPLLNGLYAVFRDTFDIRKFGIVSSKTLDQTVNLKRMVAYADSREYVIDFHNFHIMTPDIVQYTSTRGTIFRGMGFNHVHDIQNIRLCNNKTIPLYQGTTPLMFLPKRKGDGAETFKLTNIRFDLFVDDVVRISGEGDGRFHGFYAGWHPDYPVTSPTHLQSESGYNFEADGIYADTAGRTSTMALNIWFNDIKFKNMFGEYIGYYTTHFGTRVTGENVHVVFRDDIYAATESGMVSNALQEEQEVGPDEFAYTQEYQRFKNMSCHRYTDGSEYTVIKRQVMGTPTLKEWRCENIKGAVTVNTAGQNLTVNKFTLDNVTKIGRLYSRVLEFYAKNSSLTELIENSSRNQTSLFEFTKCTINAELFYDATVIDKVTFDECIFNTAVSRRALAKIKEVVINGGETNYSRLLEADFERVEINNLKIKGATATESFIYKRGENWTNSSVNFNFVYCTRTPTLLAALEATLTETQALNVSVRFSGFPSLPTFRLGLGSLDYKANAPQLQGSKTYNPPSIAPAGADVTTVTLSRVQVGDFVQATFSQYHADIEISAVVSESNIVTVKFKNTGSTAVDLPSGTLTVKLV